MADKRVQLKVLFGQMSDLTAPECNAKKCRCATPTLCCDAMYCEMALQFSKDFWNEDISDRMIPDQHLPFMGPGGCVLEPHLRPLCTLHTCEINAFGFKRGDPAWTKKYHDLRDKIDEVTYAVEKESCEKN